MTAEVVYRLVFMCSRNARSLRVVERDIVVLDELSRVLGAVEVQAMPIDDRAACQDQAQRLDVVEPKLLDAFEPLARHPGFRSARRRWGVG
jgi:hypothetical protein